MKTLLLLIVLTATQAYATFTTINGVVLCNCMPPVDPQCKSQCESMRYQKSDDGSDNTLCQCC